MSGFFGNNAGFGLSGGGGGGGGAAPDLSAYAEKAAANVFSENQNVEAAKAWAFAGRSKIFSPADGKILLQDDAETGFTSLQFGGTTSSFPALKRSGTTLEARLADDSAFAPFSASSLYTSNGISTGGNIFATAGSVFTGNVHLNDAGVFGFDTRSRMYSPADGQMSFRNNANTAFAGILAKYFAPDTLTDAAAPNSSLYFSSDAGKLVWKNAAGVVNALY